MAFTKGHKLSPGGGKRPGAGRKPNDLRAELPALLDEAIPRADRVAILREQVQAAKNGNTKAAALVLAYLYGKPVDRIESTGEEGGPMKIQVEYADPEPKEE